MFCTINLPSLKEGLLAARFHHKSEGDLGDDVPRLGQGVVGRHLQLAPHRHREGAHALRVVRRDGEVSGGLVERDEGGEALDGERLGVRTGVQLGERESEGGNWNISSLVRVLLRFHYS